MFPKKINLTLLALLLIVSNSGFAQNSLIFEAYNRTACGLDYVSAVLKTTTRYSSPVGSGIPATLNISGIPASASIDRAFIWWTESTSSPVAPATITVTNPLAQSSNIVPLLLGTGQDKCWGLAGSIACRADITTAISGNGNYIINIPGPNTSASVDGIAMVVIFDDPNITMEGTMVINDGYVLERSAGINSHMITNFSACANSSTGSGFVVAGDLQDNLPGNHSARINGVLQGFTSLFFNLNILSATVNNAQSSSFYEIHPYTNGSGGGDCYLWCTAGLYYRTGCLVCVLDEESIELEAEMVQSQTKLDWVVGPDMNKERMVVQHSINGADFQDLGDLQREPDLVNYQFYHSNPVPYSNYYRISAVDELGEEIVSNVVEVEFSGTDRYDIELYPNPVTDQVNLEIRSWDNQTFNWQLFNLQGKSVMSGKWSISPGMEAYQLDVSKIASGNYFLVLNSPTFNYRERVIVEH